MDGNIATLLWGGALAYFAWRWLFKPAPSLAVWTSPIVPADLDVLAKQSFVLFSVGTRGDVQPMIALAIELKKRGFPVCVCAPDQFQSLVESYQVTFASCGLASLADQEAGWLKANTESEFLSVIAKAYLPKYVALGSALVQACERRNATFVVTGVYGLHVALDVAEKMNVKVRGIKYMPEGMSRFQPPFGVETTWKNPYAILFLHMKRLVRMVWAARSFGLTKVQNEFRTQILGIGKVTKERLESGGKYLPIMFAYSEHLAPRPKDWPPWHKTVGFLFTPEITKSLPDELENFLKRGPPPVAITFGSMSSLRAAGCDVIARAHQACVSLGLRVVIISSWTGIDEKLIKSTDNTLIMPQASHELLFRRCSLVIHHGGAGTTARVAQSGVPSIIIPILRWLDQRGWAMMVEKFGAGIHLPSPFATEPEIRQAVARVLIDPVKLLVYQARARDLARRIQGDGDAAVRAVDWLLQPTRTVEYDTTYYRKEAIERMVTRSCLYH